MRQTTGGIWLFQLMILFILLFAGYIILTIEYSKNVKVKNEMISIVERYDGLNEKSINLLNNYLISTGYNTMGKCETGNGVYGSLNLQDNELTETDSDSRYYYCIKKYKGANTSYYYQVAVFYRFNLPVIGDLTRYRIKGTTSNFQSRDDNNYCMTISGVCRESSEFTRPNGNQTTYTVSFDLNGGTGNIPSQTVRSGRRADQPSTNPTKEGYIFGGWTLNGDIYDFYRVINSDITLIARWDTLSGSNPNGSNSGEFTVPSGYTLAGVCSTSTRLSLKDFIINCGQNYGYYTSSQLIISGFPVTNGVKTTLLNMQNFVCSDYSRDYNLNYTQAEMNTCDNELTNIYNSLPQKVIYK